MENKDTNHKRFFKLFIAWLVAFCAFGFRISQAQDAVQQYSDSLLNSALKAPTTELKIEGLLGVSIFWSDRDTAKAYKYLEAARQQMGKSPIAFQQGLYQLYRANILMEYDQQQAKRVFLHADSLLATDQSQKSYRYRAKLWNNYGVLIQSEDKGKEFMNTILTKTLPYARHAGDSAQVAYQFQNVATQLADVQDYAGAADYYQKALHTLRNLPGQAEHKLEIFSNSAKNAVLLRDYVRAKIHIDSAQRFVKIIPHSTAIPAFYRTKLTYFRHIKDYQKALQSYRKGVTAAQQLGNQYMLMDLNFELHLLYKERGDYALAKHYLELSNQYRPFHMLRSIALHHYEMAQLEYHLRNYKSAYEQLDTASTIMDSIYQKDLATKVLNLEKQHKAAEKENRILRLETKNKQQELAIAKSRWWELSLAAGLALAVFVAYFWWKISKKNKKLLIQNNLLHKEELRSMRQQERLSQYDAMLQGQEAERSRMAQDLHDGLGGLLAGVKLKLSSIVARAGEAQVGEKNAINDVVGQLDYSVDELRRIAHDMMPESLRFGGLAPALSDLCRYMGTPMVQVVFQNLGIKDNYPDQLRVTVYRVVQELLTNAIKHANATKIILQCSELDNWLFVTVEDNGKGMDQREENRKKGLGLINIRNRISLLNGDIETVSHPGEGTTVNIQIPKYLYNGE